MVGGLAVIARVTTADRATTDIDSVLDGPEGDETSVELLAAADVGVAAEGAPQRRIVDGIPVDLIDTTAIDDDDLEGIDERHALFVGGHRFAYDTAETVHLRVGETSTTVALATPASLVATKLHAARYRRNSEKLPGDLFDLYRLLTDCDNPMMVDALETWPRLAALIRTGIRQAFIDEATKSSGRIRIANAARADAVTDADVIAAAELFLAL